MVSALSSKVHVAFVQQHPLDLCIIEIYLLRGLHPKEAEVIILTKDKKLSSKYKISLDNVKEAYSDIQWGNRS